MVQTDDIFSAVQSGDLNRVRDLVQREPSLARACNADGLSVLLFARYRSLADALAILLSVQPALDIFEAAALGDSPRVEQLLAAEPGLAGAWSPDGFTPLHLAAFFGHADVAAQLLARGADVNAVSHNAMTVMPLHSAVAGRHHAAAELLMAHGADVNAAQHGSWTPLHGAAQHGDRRLVETLLAHGADRNALNAADESPGATARAAGHPAIAELLEG